MPPGSSGSSGGNNGGPRIEAGSIVYKFKVEVDDALHSQIQSHVEYVERLLKRVEDANKSYEKLRRESEGGFKGLKLAAAGFFAMVAAHSSTARDMLGGIFTSMGTVMNSIAIIFLPMVIKLITFFTNLATEVQKVAIGSEDLGDALQRIAHLAAEGIVDLTKLTVKLGWEFLVEGIPAISTGIENFASGINNPVIRNLVEMLLEVGAYSLMGNLVGSGLKRVGIGSGVDKKTAILLGIGGREYSQFMGAMDGDARDTTQLLSGAGGAILGGLLTKDPRMAMLVGLGAELTSGMIFDTMNPDYYDERIGSPTEEEVGTGLATTTVPTPRDTGGQSAMRGYRSSAALNGAASVGGGGDGVLGVIATDKIETKVGDITIPLTNNYFVNDSGTIKLEATNSGQVNYVGGEVGAGDGGS